MTTPSKYRRLNEAANLYIDFIIQALAMCHTIKHLHGGLKFQQEVTEENKQLAEDMQKVAAAVEAGFHEKLDPYVLKLEEIAKSINDNLPQERRIILPGSEPN